MIKYLNSPIFNKLLKYEKVGHFRKDYYESLRTGLLYYNEYVHRVLRAEKQSVQLF